MSHTKHAQKKPERLRFEAAMDKSRLSDYCTSTQQIQVAKILYSEMERTKGGEFGSRHDLLHSDIKPEVVPAKFLRPDEMGLVSQLDLLVHQTTDPDEREAAHAAVKKFHELAFSNALAAKQGLAR